MEDKILEILIKPRNNKIKAVKHVRESYKEVITDLLALFTQSVEEIIGKDEDAQQKIYATAGGISNIDYEASDRNKLRAQQRARLAILIKQ